MKTRILLFLAALMIASLLGAGLLSSRTVVITPRETDTLEKTETTALSQMEETAVVFYVLNKSSKRFHRPQCNSAQRIKEENRETFEGARDALLAEGYVPCKICAP